MTTSDPSSTDLSTPDARSAFEATEPELIALDTGDIHIPNVNVQRAAAIAHSIAVRDLDPARFKRFELLAPTELYHPDNLARLARLSLATWFTRQQQVGQQALITHASVPEAIIRQAHKQRSVMLRVLEYWLDDDPTLMTEVAAIRAGAGHQDLANDLQQLADIYQRPAVRPVIEQDHRHVRPDDSEQAHTLARSIFTGLGLAATRSDRRWADLCQRAWTLLRHAYEDHQAAGVFLFHAHEDVDQTYPSLITATRSVTQRRGVQYIDEVPMEAEPTTTRRYGRHDALNLGSPRSSAPPSGTASV